MQRNHERELIKDLSYFILHQFQFIESYMLHLYTELEQFK